MFRVLDEFRGRRLIIVVSFYLRDRERWGELGWEGVRLLFRIVGGF